MYNELIMIIIINRTKMTLDKIMMFLSFIINYDFGLLLIYCNIYKIVINSTLIDKKNEFEIFGILMSIIKVFNLFLNFVFNKIIKYEYINCYYVAISGEYEYYDKLVTNKITNILSKNLSNCFFFIMNKMSDITLYNNVGKNIEDGSSESNSENEKKNAHFNALENFKFPNFTGEKSSLCETDHFRDMLDKMNCDDKFKDMFKNENLMKNISMMAQNMTQNMMLGKKKE